MYINFKDLVEFKCQPEILSPEKVQEEKKALIQALFHDNVDEGLIQWVDELLEQAERSGYHGGYSDAHWYARGQGDGA